MPSEPPTPSTEQIAEWQALVERIRQDDHSQVVAWDEVAATPPEATYRSSSPSGSTSGSATPCPCWPARSLASSRSFGWIRPKLA
jgi:hypothetical protein